MDASPFADGPDRAATAEVVPEDHAAAYREAYSLLEQVQGEHHQAARDAAHAALLRARQAGWTDVGFILRVAGIVHDLPHLPAVESRRLTADLRRRAGDLPTSYLAVALALSALMAEDVAEQIKLTSQAVALLDDERLPGMSRALGYVIAAANFNAVNLWELADEQYQSALTLGAACDDSLQTDAIAVNRVLIRLEWALALIENGDGDEKPGAVQAQIDGVAAAAASALMRPLRPLWRANVLACWDIVRMLGCDTDAELRDVLSSVRASTAGYRPVLVEGDDVESLASLDAALALSEHRVGDRELARRMATALAPPRSVSSGARSFVLWARARILMADQPDGVVASQREYTQLVSRMRWQSRAAVLAAAKAQISTERRRFEHDRLQLAVQTDDLTGLANRRVFDQALRESSGPAALVLIDVDEFKRINDTFGHHVGDDVLRRIGGLMRASCRTDDLAIRQGGDEFALVLLGETVTPATAADLAWRLASAVRREPWADLADGLSVSVSIGLAHGVIDPSRVDGDGVRLDARLLYLSADAALYQSKHSGGTVTVASPARLAS